MLIRPLSFVSKFPGARTSRTTLTRNLIEHVHPKGFELRRVPTAVTSAGIKAGCLLARSFDLRFSASSSSRKILTKCIFEMLRLASLTRKRFGSGRFR